MDGFYANGYIGFDENDKPCRYILDIGGIDWKDGSAQVKKN